MRYLRVLILSSILPLLLDSAGVAQLPQCSDQGTWSTYNFTVGGLNIPIGTPLLLTNGSVMLQYTGSLPNTNQLQDWYLLTPDINGCYGNANGCSATITPLASLVNVWQNPQYGPSAMASAVLSDGKVVIEGGEFNMCQCNSKNRCESNRQIRCGQCVGGVGRCETTLGAIYDPQQNTWTAVSPPVDANGNPWTAIGDAPSTVLPDTRYMLGNACSAQTALFQESSLSWEQNGDQQAFGAEENYVQLPNGTVLAVDTCWPGQPCMTFGGGLNSEAYDPASKTWSSLGDTPQRLYSYGHGEANSCYANSPIFGEQGPSALRPDGTVFVTGALDQTPTFNYTTHTAVYNTTTRQWQSSPDLPAVSLGMGSYIVENEDQSGVVLPDGNFLMVTFPNLYYGTLNSNILIEWDGRSYCQINNVPDGMYGQLDMLLLPSGQVMFTDVNYWISSNYYLYTPGGTVYPGIAPTVHQFPNAVLRRGATYTVSGTRFGGYSSGSVFGDDFQNYTNYPIVQIRNDASGHVFYARTHDHSTMGVFTGDTPTYTQMDVPPNMETGPSHLVVVTNGIASNAVPVNIQ